MKKHLILIFGISVFFSGICIHAQEISTVAASAQKEDSKIASVAVDSAKGVSATRKQMLDEVKKNQLNMLPSQAIIKDGSSDVAGGDLGAAADTLIKEYAYKNAAINDEDDDEKEDDLKGSGVAPKVESATQSDDDSSDVDGKTFKQPWQLQPVNKTIDIVFENTELSNFISYIEKQFGLTFILDDAITPLAAGAKSVLGSKITFTSYKSLNKKQAWDLFVQFLDIAGLAVVQIDNTTYRIITNDPNSPRSANRNPLPTYFDIELSELPDNDSLIRYVYFVENASLDVIKNVVDNMRSTTSAVVVTVPDIKALIITDKARSIRQMLTIIYELDKVSSPETVTIVKLQHADASKVAKLYNDGLMPNQSQDFNARLMGARKPSTVSYFPEGTRVIAEPRTNSLILLGQNQAVKKIEDFVVHNIDRQVTLPFSPLHTYELKYTDADAVAKIISEVVKFQPDSDAAKFGGVRDGEKYFKNVTVVAEQSGNRLVISSSYEEFEKIKELIERIDIEQPQVALKIFIFAVGTEDARGLGVQLRNMKPNLDGILGKNVNFQTSGLTTQGVIENPNTTAEPTNPAPGAQRLLGNLINLVSGVGSAGSTLVTLGCDAFGVWGMLRMLQSYANVSLISNPFVITTNRYAATIAAGEIRRVITGYVSGPNSTQVPTYDDLTAQVQIKVTPQISYEELVTLSINVLMEDFTDSSTSTATAGNRTSRVINSSVIVKNNEMIALGGILRDTISESETVVPFLHKLPLIGWLFKNKSKKLSKTFLLVLITPELIPSRSEQSENSFTKRTVRNVSQMLNGTNVGSSRDPIERWFFMNGQKKRIVQDVILPTQNSSDTQPENKERNDLVESIQDMVVIEQPEYKMIDQDVTKETGE